MVEITLEPYRSWKQVQSRPGYDLTWKCDAGWLFARVWDRIVVRYLYDRYGALTANAVRWGSGVAPTAGSAFPYTILQDGNVPPRRVLRQQRKNMLWEVFPSLNHPTCLFYLRTPQTQPRGGMTNEIGNSNPNYQDPFGYWFEGKDSDVEDPTEAGMFYIPPWQDTEIGLVNTQNYEIRPQSIFIINQLHLQPFDPRTAFGARNIARILGRPAQATMGSAGAEPYKVSTQEFVDYFGVSPVLWDGARAKYLEKTDKGEAEHVIAEVG